MNKVELATKLKISRARIYQLIAQGMPVDSEETAQAWRRERASMRLPASSKLLADEIARPSESSNGDLVFRPSGDQFFDLLLSARIIQGKAREMVIDAMNGEKFAAIPSLIANHNKSVEAALEAERAYREELQRRNLLAPKQQIIEVTRRVLEPMLRRLKRIAAETGPKLAQKDAVQVTAILDRDIKALIQLCEEALNEPV